MTKTLNDFKYHVARQIGNPDWYSVNEDLRIDVLHEAAELYATHKAEEARKEAIKIGRKVKVNYAFPLSEEVFEIVGERKESYDIMGDFSAGTHNVQQCGTIPKSLVKEWLPLT